MAKTIQVKPEEVSARGYADRLILEQLTALQAAVKLSDLADRLQKDGLGLAAIRSLLASNPERFAYADRRWVPAARIEGLGRSFREAVRLIVDRFGGPIALDVLLAETAHATGEHKDTLEPKLRRIVERIEDFFVTAKDEVALASWAFVATDESRERALALNGINEEELSEATKKAGKVDWNDPKSLEKALKSLAPISLKMLGALAWQDQNVQDPTAELYYDWRQTASLILSAQGFTYGSDGTITSDEEAKKWISTAVKFAERIAPSVEIEDAAPIEVKAADVKAMAAKIVAAKASVTATKLLEETYEVTPSVKTFPDDMENVMNALRADSGVWWVGGDRFRKPNSAPDFIYSVPELFQYKDTDFKDEEGEFVDCELSDEGLSSTLRRLLTHPLATDVLDEEIMPAPKQQAETLRLVLKPIHRELGTFPLCQVPTGWLDDQPNIQELLMIDQSGRELEAWANMEARLVFNMVDWFYEQPVESGAVFSITRTHKPNVFEFQWLDQTDPVVFITTQRMEELRELQARSEELSTLQILQEVMSHWPKGADFLTILWEVNVVRRVKRRLVASLLSSYVCFYQRSGSPVWHYDAKKVEQGFDKTKRKFVLKR